MKKEPLRWWNVPTDAVPYISGTMSRGTNLILENVLIAEERRALISFRGSYPFLEDQICKEFTTIIRDERWPNKPFGGADD